MENVMSITSAAHVKFESWGNILALNKRCFVENEQSVLSLHIFLNKMVLLKEELIVKNAVKGVRKGYILDKKELWG